MAWDAVGYPREGGGVVDHPTAEGGGATRGWPGSVQSRLAFGAGFPAAVDPEPLVGILAGVFFDDLVEERGIGQGVGFCVAGRDKLQRGIEADAVLAEFAVPDGEGRQDGGAGMQRYARNAGGGAGWDAEERDEGALGRRHVGVHEDAGDLAATHGGEQT